MIWVGGLSNGVHTHPKHLKEKLAFFFCSCCIVFFFRICLADCFGQIFNVLPASILINFYASYQLSSCWKVHLPMLSFVHFFEVPLILSKFLGSETASNKADHLIHESVLTGKIAMLKRENQKLSTYAFHSRHKTSFCEIHGLGFHL